MDYLNKVKGCAKGIADVGVSFIALGIVLEILFNSAKTLFISSIYNFFIFRESKLADASQYIHDSVS